MFVNYLGLPPAVYTFTASSGYVPKIANISIPDVSIPGQFTGEPTSLNLESGDIKAAVKPAAYVPSTISILWPNIQIPTPTYRTPATTPTLPSVSSPAAPTNYPTFGNFPDISAGLTPVEKPVIEIAERTGLTPIELLLYEPTLLEPFSAEIPTYSGVDDEALPVPVFTRDPSADSFVQALKEKIAMVEPVVSEALQRAMFNDETKYLERKELFGINKIMSESASRGFSLATGVVNGAVAELLNETRVERRETAEKVRDEAYERTRNVIAEALAALINFERQHVARILSYASKTIELQRFNVRIAVEAFNAFVAAFNEQAKAAGAVVEAYRAYVRAIADQDRAVIAQIASEKARIDTYRADVQMFRSQVDLLQAAARVNELDLAQRVLVLREFETRVDGYRQNIETAKISLEGFRTAINTMSGKIEEDLAKVQAQIEATDAEASKLGVFESNIGAYMSFLRTEAEYQSGYARYVNSSLSAFMREVENYRQYGEAQRSVFSALASEVEAKQGAVRAFLSATDTAVRHNEAYNQGNAEVTNAQNMARLALSDAAAKIKALNLQAEAEQKRIDLGLKAATATASAGLAQAAYSTRSSTARLSDDGTFNYSSNREWSRSISVTGTRSWNQTTTHEKSV